MPTLLPSVTPFAVVRDRRYGHGMAADGRRHVVAIGGGMLMPRDAIPFHVEYAIKLSGKADAAAVRAEPGRRRRPRLLPPVLRPAGELPRRGPPPVAVPDAERRGPRGLPAVAGHHLRRRRLGRQHDRGVARARHRPDPAQGLAGGHRAGRLVGRRHLLVRGRDHGLLRRQAAGVHRRARDAGRAASARTTTPRPSGARCTSASSPTAPCPAAWPATTASARTTSTTRSPR